MKQRPVILFRNARVIRIILFFLMILIPSGLVPRVVTDAYYTDTHSYNRTGLGIDPEHQPVGAASFLTGHHLEGRILNSIAFGGWLSWSLPQPVFIDGRLEVMKESLYSEIVESWSGGLQDLIRRYRPDLVVYNYIKYYPWTVQLVADPGWRPLYIDGFSVIFARNDYACEIPSLDFHRLPELEGIREPMTDRQETALLESYKPELYLSWFEGFYRPTDEKADRWQNIASFCLQMKQADPARRFFLESLRHTGSRKTSVFYALADIYRLEGNAGNSEICYRKILLTDPDNRTAFDALAMIRKVSSYLPHAGQDNENDARAYFNSGNQKYRYGDVSGAISDYTRAISIWPGYYKAYNNRGIARAIGLKQFAEAARDFDTAISIRPDYAEAWLGRGTAKFNLKDFRGACSDWEKARSLGNRQAGEMILLHCQK